jgi:hypothetical protein
MPTTSDDARNRSAPHSRLPRTPKATAGRRGSHASTRSDAATRSRRGVSTQDAPVAGSATPKGGRVRRFARWLTDGSTDRPHLRF